MYDSANEIKEHIELVVGFIEEITKNLSNRAKQHDISKLSEPEKSIRDEFSLQVKGLAYNSEEYRLGMLKMKDALEHHYKSNSHHPEHYENGISGMSLLDIIEMLADWKAATLRHKEGNIYKSLEINKDGMTDQLYLIFQNTIKELNW